MKRLLTLLFILLIVKNVSSQQWSYEYPINDNEYVIFITGDMSLNYNYVFGTIYIEDTNMSHPVALCFADDGCCKERIFDNGFDGESFITSVGLGDGNVFVAASCSDDAESKTCEKIWIAVLNPDLDIIAEKYLDYEEPYIAFGLSSHALLNDNKEIVFVTKVTDSITEHVITEYDFLFYKIDINCNLLKQSYLENPSRYSDISDFIKVPNTNCYAMYSNGMTPLGVETVSYVDDELNYLSTTIIDDFDNYPNNILPMFVCVDYWYDQSHFLMSAISSNTDGINDWHPLVLKMDTEMNIQKTLSLERIDTTDYVSQFRSMAYVNQEKIYISTFWQNMSYFEFYPNTATVFLINDDLEILGRKDFDFGEYMNILYIQPTYDEGCIIHVLFEYDDYTQMVIYKLNVDDFEMLTDIEECEEDFEVRLSPNPASSVLNIDVDDMMDKEANVTIFDMLGRSRMDRDVSLDGNTVTLDVSILEKGMYFCVMTIDERRVLRKKFVKE